MQRPVADASTDGQTASFLQAAADLLADDAGFDAHWEAFQQAFQDRDESMGPPVVWPPRPEGTHLAALMQATGTPDYPALHAWSVQEPESFWQTTIDALGIPFQTPPTRILAGEDVRDPEWLPGARFNAASMCFQAPSDRIAIVQGDEAGATTQLTYGDLQSLCGQVSNGLQAMGLQKGDAVALYMPMNIECVAAYLGIVQAGMAAISIPDSFAAPEVATRLRLGGAKAVITVDAFQRGGKAIPMYPKAKEAAEGVPVVVIGDTELADGDVAWAGFLGEPEFEPVACSPQDVSNILFSSGTTGEPKAIPWTHLTPIKAAGDGRWHQDIHETDVVAWPTNIGWMMGPWLIYASLGNDATMALFEGVPTSPAFMQFLRDSKISMLGVVPAIVRAWKESGVRPGAVPSVRVFSSTGEASNQRDYLYLMSLAGYQAPIIEYCGGTEIGGGHITGTLLQPASPATFTTPAMGLDVVILDDEGNRVRTGGMGEIFLIPPSIGLSQRLLNRDHHQEYYEGTPKGPEGQVLRRHGDEMQVLPGGFYTAQGRADDTMNLGGIKVGSIELERAMNGHPTVSETAAVAIRPPEGGADRLVVFAVLHEDADKQALQNELQARIKQHLNPLFRIHDVVFVSELPRTASNKIMRRELRAQYGGP